MANYENSNSVQIFRKIKKELTGLIENTYLTFKFCDCEKYQGIIHIDGTYVAVKGYSQKIPFIYTVDHFSHDIPVGILSVSENSEIFLKLFRLLKTVKYPLRMIIIDDIRKSVEIPLKQHFPRALIQLCHTHYLKKLKDLIDQESRRKNVFYDEFYKDLVKLFKRKSSFQKKKREILFLLKKYSLSDNFLEMIVLKVLEDRKYLFAYLHLEKEYSKNIPSTNNLIEGFNTQLKNRLKQIKNLKSFKTAEGFLNAWMLRRRTLPFSDCKKKFRFLNGFSSLEIVLKDNFKIKDVCKEIGVFWRK